MTNEITFTRLNKKFEELFKDRPNLLQDINEVLKDVFSYRYKYNNIDEVIESFCIVTGFTKQKLLSGTRKREILEPRQLLIYKIKEIFGTRYTLKQISTAIGGRDHATIIHSIQSCRDKIHTKDEFTMDILIQWELYTENKFVR